METHKNILNSSIQYSIIQQLPTLTEQPNKQEDATPENDIMQSFLRKKQALQVALEYKRNGRTKEYYQQINQQSFVNAKEEPIALRIWVKVFIDSMSMLIHDYQDYELIDLLIFKLPWFNPTTTHGQNFSSYMRLIMSLFPHDVSYVHKVIKHIFSPHGLFQCIMIGEHRPPLSELLWEKAHSILTQQGKDLTEEQKALLQKKIKDLNTTDEIMNYARQILKKNTDQQELQTHQFRQIRKVFDKSDQIFLKALFSYHPTKRMPEAMDYPIYVGLSHKQLTFFVQTLVLSDNATPDDDDALSLKKCLNGLIQAYSERIKSFASEKSEISVLKRLGQFLVKIMKTYPFVHQSILQNLLEKLPHKNMSVENQVIYYNIILQVATDCPETEEKILEALVERLCQIDVDMKGKHRRYAFSKRNGIQTLTSYLQEIKVKIQDEKEIKLGILLEQLLNFISNRIEKLTNENQEDFIDSLMKMFENKIFPINKLNFMQYLPFYVMTLKPSAQNTVTKIFTEKLLSFLISKTFNCLQREHLSIRQQAWNYLSSLVSRQNNVIKEQTLIKCLQLVMRYYENYKQRKQSSYQSCGSSTESAEPLCFQKAASQERIFQHCFIQGLILILITKTDQIYEGDPIIFQQICRIIFKKGFNSLQYTSPIILYDLLKLTETNKYGLGVFSDKIRKIFLNQEEDLKTSKRKVYGKVSKFLPYEQPIYLYSVVDKFSSHLIYQDAPEEIFNNKEIQKDEKMTNETLQLHSTNSNLEEEKVMSNSTILYTPDLTERMEMDSPSRVSLERIIARQRKNQHPFNTDTLSHDIDMKKIDQQNNSILKLNATSLALQEFERQRNYSEDLEVISSSRETEYSVSQNTLYQQFISTSAYTSQRTLGSSPTEFMTKKIMTPIDQENIKVRLRRTTQRNHRNLTMQLREFNKKAEQEQKHMKESVQRQGDSKQ